MTGASSGIGRAIALALAREGADLFLLDIDDAGLAATAGEAERAGVTAMMRVCDLARPAEISAAIGALVAAWGRLDILVNNAGIAYYGPTDAMSDAHWDRLLAINLLAPIQLTRELMPMLAAAGEAHIVNVCSFLGLVPARKMVAYQTSKFGLVGYSMAMRAEYGRAGFGVTTLCPGFVRTAMVEDYATSTAKEARHVMPPWLTTTADAVAKKAISAIHRNKGLVVFTPLARIWWWLMRLSPGLADWLTREGWRRKGKVTVAPRSR